MLSTRLSGPVISLFRMVVGTLFACHGAASLFGVFGGAMGTGATVPIGSWPAWWAALIQLVGGLLVALGLGTRPAALLCSGSMAYAYFVVHQPEALLPLRNGGELAALFCWSFLTVAVLGAGPWALDRLFGKAGRRQADSAGPSAQPSPLSAVEDTQASTSSPVGS